jgi:ubiquinone/menaquinone biosynthesis C-methylase UbiE
VGLLEGLEVTRLAHEEDTKIEHFDDLSASIGKQAQQHYAGLRTLVRDTRRLPFPRDIFDLIVSNSTLDHFSTGEEIAAAIGEIVRVLKPMGHLVITLDNPAYAR